MVDQDPAGGDVSIPSAADADKTQLVNPDGGTNAAGANSDDENRTRVVNSAPSAFDQEKTQLVIPKAPVPPQPAAGHPAPNAQPPFPAGPPPQQPGFGATPPPPPGYGAPPPPPQNFGTPPPPPAGYGTPPPPPPGFGTPPPPPAGFGAPPQQPGFGAPTPSPSGYGTPAPPGFGATPPQSPGYGTPPPPPGYGPGAPTPGGYPPNPPGPQNPYSANGAQSPMEAANALLSKSNSFIAQLMSRGIRGELLRQPWFQKWRQTPQQSDQFIYLTYAGGILLAIMFGLLGSIGTIFGLAIGIGLCYLYFALGTKKAHQFIAYGICGVGVVLSLISILFTVAALVDLSSIPYSTGSLMLRLLFGLGITVITAAILGYVGIQVHRGIQRMSSPPR
ncbi:hypothetical protein [Mycolicibacterium houstonense]|uniref:hypothetical protein n=1 Tax=Mycolicibacterium houstonense TaxID=146021 RepID=UPI000AA70767|nr:hypothetical protein [Mycolicibacterium houstonense]